MRSRAPIVFLAIIFMMLLLLILADLLDELRMFRIVSPSMEPLLPVGSLVLVSRSEPIGLGDIIAYNMMVEERSYTIVHRVVGVEDGYYMVRADAVVGEGFEIVGRDKVVGKVVLAIPFIGYLAGVLAAFPTLLIALLIMGRGGAGFLTAAFASTMPAIFPVQGLAAHLGQHFFTAAMVCSSIIVRVLEDKLGGWAGTLYGLITATSVLGLDVSEVVKWFA